MQSGIAAMSEVTCAGWGRAYIHVGKVMSHVASAEYLKGVLQNDTSEENYSPRTYSKYEASLLYIASSRPARATL